MLIVYTLKTYHELKKRGFKSFGIDANPVDSRYLIYYFERTEESIHALEEIYKTFTPKMLGFIKRFDKELKGEINHESV